MGSLTDDIKSAFRKQHNVLMQLILINLFVFLVLILVKAVLSFSPQGQSIYTAITSKIELNALFQNFIYKPWTIITYSFTHYGFWHIISNMLTLYWFGQLVQEYIGSQKLLNIYLLGGIFSGMVYLCVFNICNIMHLNNIGETIVGASAAVFAVIFAATTLLPEYEFFLFGLIMIKIRYLAWFFLLLSFMSPSSGISHVGGAFFGFIYIKLLQGGTDLGSPIEAVIRWWKNITTPKPETKIARRPVGQTTASASRKSGNISNVSADYFPDQDEIDAILDKIGKSGYESLTREEKQKLYRASQRD